MIVKDLFSVIKTNQRIKLKCANTGEIFNPCLENLINIQNYELMGFKAHSGEIDKKICEILIEYKYPE